VNLVCLVRIYIRHSPVHRHPPSRSPYMASSSSRPSTASAKIRSKTSELHDLFRGRQHSSAPPPSADSSNKPKRKIPLFGLRKKSPAPRPGQRSPTLTPVPTPRPSTNTYVFRPSKFHADCSRVRRVEPHIHPRSHTQLGHIFRSLPFLPHLLHHYLLLMTPLPNVPQLHLRTHDLRGPGRVRPLLNLHMG
jgi:hypothetical protein